MSAKEFKIAPQTDGNESMVVGGGCPMRSPSQPDTTIVTQPQVATINTTISPEQEFLKYSSKKTKDLFDGLRAQTEVIEHNIALGENEVLLKDEIAFLIRRNDLGVANLANSQVQIVNVDRWYAKEKGPIVV